MSDEIDVPRSTSNVTASAGNRTKASKYRRRVREGGTLSPEEVAWLEDYEAAQRRSELPSARAASSSREVTYTEKENHSAAEVHGEGTTAFVAATAAATREEGRRLDLLLSGGVQAWAAAFDRVLKMNDQLLTRNANLETAHIDLINAVTKGHVDLTAAQIETMRADAAAEIAESRRDETGGIEGIVRQALPTILNELAKRSGHSLPKPPGKS